MKHVKWIVIGIVLGIARRLFVNETKRLSRRLGISVWKVQALILSGIIVCVGGVWYVYTKGFKDGFSNGSKDATEKAAEKIIKAAQDSFRKGEREGAWRAVHEISTLDPLNEYIQWLDELGVAVMDKYERFENFSRSYNRTYWGFKGEEWD